MTYQTQAASLKKVLSTIAGVDVDITVRGERSFTFSFDGTDAEPAALIRAFFVKQAKSIEIDRDEECGTFIYCEV